MLTARWKNTLGEKKIGMGQLLQPSSDAAERFFFTERQEHAIYNLCYDSK